MARRELQWIAIRINGRLPSVPHQLCPQVTTLFFGQDGLFADVPRTTELDLYDVSLVAAREQVDGFFRAIHIDQV